MRCMLIMFLTFTLLFGIVIVFSALFSSTIWYGLIVLFLVALTLVLIREALKLNIFPGSCWIIKRNIEYHYCVEMCGQVLGTITDFKDYLEGIKSNTLTVQSDYTHNTKKLILTLIGTYQTMQKRTKRQKNVLYILENLQIALEHVNISAGQSAYNLWAWIEIRLNLADTTCIYTENALEIAYLNKAMQYCSELEDIFQESLIATNPIKRAYLWIFNDVLGTIDYMRADLFKRFQCQEYDLKFDNKIINW